MDCGHFRSWVSILLLAGSCFAASNPSFLTPKTFSVGKYGVSNPVSVATADFNGDGKLDLAVAEQGLGFQHVRGFVAVLLGNGDGTFKPAVEYTAGSVPEFITVGDLNKDGKIDLVVANFGSNNVSVLLGNGDGTFQTHMDFGTVNGPTSLVVGDFNNDGKLDVASTDADFLMSTRGSVAVLLGNGDGTLQAAVSSPAGGDIQAITAGDFNGDGVLDLAVANKTRSSFHGNLAILLGNGDGTFKTPVKYLSGYSLTFAVAADFNQDGFLDIATAEGALVLGNGDGTFGPPISIPLTGGPFAVGDLNGDGIPDIASAQYTCVGVDYGVGDGTFQATSYYPGGTSPSSIAIGDFNGDHHTDLAVTNRVDANVAVILAKSKPAGQFRTPSVYSVYQSAFADFNGDHFPDMVSTRYVTYDFNKLQLYVGNGDGTFQSPTNYSLAQSADWVATGDFNHDGKNDVAIGVADNSLYCQNPAVVIMLGTGNGTLGGATSYSAGGCTNFIAVADVNGDGNLDILTSGSVLLGNGDGSLQSPIPINFGSVSPAQLVVGDFNNDGKSDIAAFGFGGESLAVLLGNGDGTFQPPLISTQTQIILGIAAADLNGDGRLDLVLTLGEVQPEAEVAILLGNGDGTFSNGASYMISTEVPYGVTIADLNRDGKFDIVAAAWASESPPDGEILIFPGNGDGTFGSPFTLSIGLPYSIATPDLNQDGVPDLVVYASCGQTPFLNTTK